MLLKIVGIWVLVLAMATILLFWICEHIPPRWAREQKRYWLPLVVIASAHYYPYFGPHYWPAMSLLALTAGELFSAKYMVRSCKFFGISIGVLLAPHPVFTFATFMPAVIHPFVGINNFFLKVGPISMVTRLLWFVSATSVIAITSYLAYRYCRHVSDRHGVGDASSSDAK